MNVAALLALAWAAPSDCASPLVRERLQRDFRDMVASLALPEGTRLSTWDLRDSGEAACRCDFLAISPSARLGGVVRFRIPAAPSARLELAGDPRFTVFSVDSLIGR